MRIIIVAIAGVLLLPLVAGAAAVDDIKAGHKEAAQRLLDSFSQGVKLSGLVTQNESEGSFIAYFYDDRVLVTQHFGDLASVTYSDENGHWSGSNYSLPYMLTAEDNPASIVLSLLSDGSYLEGPLWECFTYEGEEAGGYNFRFEPPGLPPVKVVLFSDPEDEQYLQMMSAEVPLAPSDPDSIKYRSFYYYDIDEEGRVFTRRETGREIDYDGSTVNFTEFIVEDIEMLADEPAELTFDMARKPVGNPGEALSGAVEVPVRTDSGYILVPLTFAESGETRYFLLDTGASASLFTPEAAELAQLGGELLVTGHGHGSRSEFELGLCTTAAVGTADADLLVPLAGFPATAIPTESRDLLLTLADYDASGIIGVSMLHQYVVTFDYPASTITLTPPHLFDATRDVPTPNIEYWLDVEDLVFIKGRINGAVEGEVIVDTGLQQELSLLKETIELNEIELTKVGEQSNTVIGGVRVFDYVEVPVFELGPLELYNTIASVTEDDRGTLSARGVLGFIGLPMFLDGRITLDLFDERMYLEPPSELGYFPGLILPPEGAAGDVEEQEDEAEGDGKDSTEQEDSGTKLPIEIG